MASAQTNTRERVEVVAGAEPVAANEGSQARALMESIDPAANVFKRLWRVEQELGAVEKTQTAEVKGEDGKRLYTYQYSGHDMVLAHVRPLLAKHGVKVWPSTKDHARVGNLTVLTVSVEFVNVDNPADRTSIEMVNYGADKGDKGASKALTNAMREAIKKALNISSQEDERADETTEFTAVDAAAQANLDKAKERAGAAIQQWGNTFRAALLTAANRKDIARLQRENSKQLSDESLPEVTRSFFVDLIEERKKVLPE